jgi:peptide/nickel transport system substrate-binding protein
MVRNSVTFMIFLLFGAMFAYPSLAVSQRGPIQEDSQTPENDPTITTLDICLAGEPATLYIYGGNDFNQNRILEAVYDGPVDLVAYAVEPVILEQMPTVDNGGVVIQSFSVTEGDTVVNAAGDVVVLAAGELIWPSGCYSDDCAITYNGGDVMMDQMEATFDLLSGLTWSDGAPLTASDSVYSFNLNGDPDTPWPRFVHERTAAYEAMSDTQIVWSGLPGYVTALSWEPNSPSVYFWHPLPEHIWGDYTALELIDATVSRRRPVGWGPYIIEDWVEGSHISLYKNPNYHHAGEGLPMFDQLIFHFSSNPLTDMLAGNCDIAPIDAPIDSYIPYSDSGVLELVVSPSAVWEHIDFGILPVETYTGFAGQTLAFQDVNIRKAFAFCLDREALQQAHTSYLYGEIFHAYLSPSHPYYPGDTTEYPFDSAQGRALLETAGWTDTNDNGIRDKNGVEFSVNMVTTDAAARLVLASEIASQLLSHCGIEMIPDPRAPGEVFADGPDGPIFGRQFDLAEFAWLSGQVPPCDLYISDQIPGLNTTWGGANASGYSNPLYDAACKTALSSLSEADKKTNHEEAARIFTEELPVLPLFSRFNAAAMTPYITGFDLDTTEVFFWNIEEFGYVVETTSIPTSSGGTLDSPIDQTAYTFPSGTFTSTVAVSHAPVSFLQTPDTGTWVPIHHTFDVSAVFEDGQPAQPTQPYTLTIQYTDGEKGTVNEDSLALYYWDGTEWVLEPTSSVNSATNTLTATPDHFSLFAILGQTHRMYLPMVRRE